MTFSVEVVAYPSCPTERIVCVMQNTRAFVGLSKACHDEFVGLLVLYLVEAEGRQALEREVLSSGSQKSYFLVDFDEEIFI